MSATLRNPLIVVEKAWKEDAPKQELIAYIKVSNSNEKKKIVNFIPIDDGSRGIEHLVGHTMKQFDRHAKEALEEGELFREFVKCLDGPTLHMWELIVSGHFPNDKDKNKANFEQAQKLLKNEVCGYNDMRDTQIFWMNYMMKKPKDMSPRDFYFRFKEIYDVSMALDGKFQMPNEHERKTMVFNAFPHFFKEKFQESAKTIEGSTTEEIINYFQILYDFEARKAQVARASNKREREDDDYRPRTSIKKQRGRDRYRQQNDDNYEEIDDKKESDKGTRRKEPCPLHPYSKYPHSWGQCRSNPDSDNFQPVRERNYNSRSDDGRVKTNGNENGHKSDKRSVEAHHYESGSGSRKKDKKRSNAAITIHLMRMMNLLRACTTRKEKNEIMLKHA
jgi:hypothetical protein